MSCRVVKENSLLSSLNCFCCHNHNIFIANMFSYMFETMVNDHLDHAILLAWCWHASHISDEAKSEVGSFRFSETKIAGRTNPHDVSWITKCSTLAEYHFAWDRMKFRMIVIFGSYIVAWPLAIWYPCFKRRYYILKYRVLLILQSACLHKVYL